MPSDDDAGSPDDDAVVSPDELDISDNDKVVEIDEGRYVIGTSGGKPRQPPDSASVTDQDTQSESSDTDTQQPDQREEIELSEEVIHQWLEEYLDNIGSDYGFDITAKFDGSVKNQQLFSNDVVTSFENLLLWYAQQAGGNTPIEEVLGILLVEANIPIKYPPEMLEVMLRKHGLSEDDSIDELLTAVNENEGVELPR
ncbi:MAG: hypothetical protein SVG88_06620 [Halobacteriales archaeon]|nr:hypothetical protein [Halobacteriales archaeon]